MEAEKRADAVTARDIESILAELRESIRVRYGREAVALCVKLHDGNKISLPFPFLGPHQPAVPPSPKVSEGEDEDEESFELHPFQETILEALDGKALSARQLGAAVGDVSRLYRRHGLRDLRTRGLVDLHPDHGYYRPDSPPPGLEE